MKPAPRRDTTRQSVTEAVRRTLDRESKRNEMRVALMRIAAYGGVVVLDVALWIAGARPAGNIVQSGSIVAVSLLILFALRRAPFFRWYGFLVPVLDAVLIYALLSVRFGAMGMTKGLVAMIAVSCGMLAATGAIRFDRRSALWTTALAAALLWAMLGAHVELASLVFSMAASVAIGLLNTWIVDQVRRAMEATRGRMVLERLLPSGVVEKAFDDPLAVLGEPRTLVATVLVTDVRGFTARAERMPPADLLAFLSGMHGAFAASVHRCGGTVDKFMGDGMLAVFGAPEPLADHAARALACVGELRRAVEQLNAARPGLDLRIGIGIHSGPMVAGCIGSGDRLEFTVIGDTVNIASRLESMTKDKAVDVLASADTVRLAGATGVTSLGEAPVRGRSQALEIFTVPREAPPAIAAVS